MTAAGAARDAEADEMELAVGQGRVTLVAAGVSLGDVLAGGHRAGSAVRPDGDSVRLSADETFVDAGT